MLHRFFGIVVEIQACMSFASYWKPFQSIKHTNAVDFVFSLFWKEDLQEGMICCNCPEGQ